jgi:hypothetical protein
MASQTFNRLFIAVGILAVATSAHAQYSLTATPYQSTGYSYYEGVNLGWNLAGRGWGFNWNGGNANPPFGPFDPNANAQIGGAFRQGPLSGGFRLSAGQGADSGMVSQTPSVVVPNGGVGFISDTTQRPFVAGIVPVVGNAYYQTPLQERLARLRAAAEHGNPERPDGLALKKQAGSNPQVSQPITVGAGSNTSPSNAERGDLSVAEIRARQAVQSDSVANEVSALIAKAKALEEAGEYRVARIYYQQAARKTTGEKQKKLLDRIQQLDENANR